jgi:hypothetical protein
MCSAAPVLSGKATVSDGGRGKVCRVSHQNFPCLSTSVNLTLLPLLNGLISRRGFHSTTSRRREAIRSELDIRNTILGIVVGLLDFSR